MKSCILCLNKSETKILCAFCQSQIRLIDYPCLQCGKPLTLSDKICGQCILKPPLNEHFVQLYAYQKPIDQFIQKLKFHHQLFYAKLFGELLAEKIQSEPYPDLILPVPLHHQRLRQRGFNQALEIARPIAKRLRIPIDKHSVIRCRNTKPQSDLSGTARKSNIQGAFTLVSDIKAKHIAIIDDVVTTGNTVFELSKALKEAGVTSITIWCVARAI